MNRRLSWRRPAVAAAAVLLAGCGQVHPGAAATVGDTRISFDQVDTLSVGFCRATVALQESQGGTVEPSEGADSRRRVLGLLLSLQLARQAADQLGVEVEPGSYVPDPQEYQSLVDQIGEQYEDDLAQIFEINAEAQALFTAIGTEQLEQDSGEVDETRAQQEGRDYVKDYAADVEIDLDPRLGLAPDVDELLDTGTMEVLSGSGSLSVPVSDEAVRPDDAAAAADAVAELPSAQVCS